MVSTALRSCGVIRAFFIRSGGDGATFHQDARSDPREIHSRAPAPQDFLGGTSARGRNGREHQKSSPGCL
eukprot:5767688-Pyramimonas_sp.AAC.1